MSTAPLECEVLFGTRWHSEQDIALRNGPFARCAWCAPTAREVVAVSPCVPIGGAGVVPLPWQLVQVRFATSTLPFMCVSRLTVVRVYPVWHEPQSAPVDG